MNSGLIIALVCVSVALVITWFSVGIKWLFIYTDYKTKKDYLREISNELDKLNTTIKKIDMSIYRGFNSDE